MLFYLWRYSNLWGKCLYQYGDILFRPKNFTLWWLWSKSQWTTKVIGMHRQGTMIIMASIQLLRYFGLNQNGEQQTDKSFCLLSMSLKIDFLSQTSCLVAVSRGYISNYRQSGSSQFQWLFKHTVYTVCSMYVYGVWLSLEPRKETCTKRLWKLTFYQFWLYVFEFKFLSLSSQFQCSNWQVKSLI